MKFKFKYLSRIVGTFIVVSIIVFVAVVVTIGSGKGWSEKTAMYRMVLFRGDGLAPGTPVKLAGIEAGTVQPLGLTSYGEVALALKLKRVYSHFIRADSIASVQVPIVGSRNIDISIGSSGHPLIPQGGLIPSREPKELMATISETVRELKLTQKLERLDNIMSNLEILTAKIKDPSGDLMTVLSNLNKASGDLKVVMADLRRTSPQLPSLVKKGNEGIEEANNVLKSLKKNWLIRGNLEKPPADDNPVIPVERLNSY